MRFPTKGTLSKKKDSVVRSNIHLTSCESNLILLTLTTPSKECTSEKNELERCTFSLRHEPQVTWTNCKASTVLGFLM